MAVPSGQVTFNGGFRPLYRSFPCCRRVRLRSRVVRDARSAGSSEDDEFLLCHEQSAVILRSAKRRLEGRSTRMQPECAGERRVDRRGGSVICSDPGNRQGMAGDEGSQSGARAAGQGRVGGGHRGARSAHRRHRQDDGELRLRLAVHRPRTRHDSRSKSPCRSRSQRSTPASRRSVRVPVRQYYMATRALDGGALGIVMPHVDTAEEARGRRSITSNIRRWATARSRAGRADLRICR